MDKYVEDVMALYERDPEEAIRILNRDAIMRLLDEIETLEADNESLRDYIYELEAIDAAREMMMDDLYQMIKKYSR